ncbi:MAG: nickel-type superoxide dismutase maturation protease [Chloroflexi bacterium]|nr:nickel-type superoxide dismutase maturation protease [Chloroflexota bacterium]
MRPVRGLIGPLVACLGVAVFVRRQLDVVEVRGQSMLPTLHPGDRLVAVRLHRPPRPGEIVIAPDPRQRGRELVKRVLSADASGISLRGDNPAGSTDARAFGAIHPELVAWRVVMRYWPPRRIGPLRRRSPVTLLAEGGEPV